MVNLLHKAAEEYFLAVTIVLYKNIIVKYSIVTHDLIIGLMSIY